MSFIVVGTNYKCSPIEIREKLSFRRNRIKDAFLELVGEGEEVKSLVILSTCNRVEVYANIEHISIGLKKLKAFFSNYYHNDLLKIEPYLYVHLDKEAVLHLVRVCSGLDSQILGEGQISEQVESAFRASENFGHIDATLDDIFSYSIKIGKKVREEIGLSEGEISVGTIAMDLIKDRIECLKNKRILIIGTGKVSELIAKHLKEEGLLPIFVSNRNFVKAEALAKEAGGIAINFGQLKERLKEVDIIISATFSPHLILGKEDILEALSKRPQGASHKAFLIIDLAVPRDIEPEVKYINGVELYSLDDLTYIVDRKLGERKLHIPRALGIIEKEVEDIWSVAKPLESEAVEAALP